MSEYRSKLGPIPDEWFNDDHPAVVNPEKKYTPAGQAAHKKFADELVAMAEREKKKP